MSLLSYIGSYELVAIPISTRHYIHLSMTGKMKIKSALFKFNTVEKVRRLPGSWQPSDYRRVLEILDIDDFESYPDEELTDMALMALQDREAEEAMHSVLANFTEGQFTKGQIQNLCDELKEDHAWEEYPSLAHQKALYICVDLLNAAFPYEYPVPSATRVNLEIRACGLDEAVAKHPLDPATLLRGVGRCQEQNNILNRFFTEQIAGAAFPEAAWVLWDLQASSIEPDALAVIFCGSSYWFEDIEEEVEATCPLEWPQD